MHYCCGPNHGCRPSGSMCMYVLFVCACVWGGGGLKSPCYAEVLNRVDLGGVLQE